MLWSRWKSSQLTYWLPPKAISNVLKRAVSELMVEALIGGRRLQWTQMIDVRTYLDIVEVRLVNNRRYANATTIPCHMKLRIILVNVLGQLVNSLRVGITTHE